MGSSGRPFEAFQRQVDVALAGLDEAFGLLGSGRASFEEVREVYAGLAQDSGNASIHNALGLAGEAVTALDTAEIAGRAGVVAFEEYLSQIGAHGRGGAAGGVAASVTEPGFKRRDIEKEHTGTEEGDDTKTKFQRAMRVGIRNASAVEKQGRTWVTAGRSYRIQLDPPPSTTYTGTVQRVDHQVIAPAQGTTPDPTDMVGNLAFVGTALVEAGSRLVRKKDGKGKHGQGRS